MRQRKMYMYITFQQTRVSSHNRAHKFNRKKTQVALNLQLPIVLFFKLIFLDMYHNKTYMYINFQQNRVSRSVKTVHINVFSKKIASCINLQLPIVTFKKSIIFDLHHHTTYMYINFQQNRVRRSVKTVHTNLFAKNCNLHKFATTNRNF